MYTVQERNKLSSTLLVACDQAYLTNIPVGTALSDFKDSPDNPQDDQAPNTIPDNWAADYGLSDWKVIQRYDDAGTGLGATVYQKTESGGRFELIVAFQGTRGPNVQDWSANPIYGWNKWNDNTAQSLMDFLETLSDDRLTQIHFAGQSLGGALAEYAAYDYLHFAPQEAQQNRALKTSLTTFNGLGGWQALRDQRDGFDESLLANVSTAHYAITNDFVHRLGGAHVNATNNMYRLETFEANNFGLPEKKDGRTLLQSIATSHRIESGFYRTFNLARNGNGFPADFTQAKAVNFDMLQIAELAKAGTTIAWSFNDNKTRGPEAGARMAVTGLVGLLAGPPNEGQILFREVADNLYNSGTIPGFLRDFLAGRGGRFIQNFAQSPSGLQAAMLGTLLVLYFDTIDRDNYGTLADSMSNHLSSIQNSAELDPLRAALQIAKDLGGSRGTAQSGTVAAYQNQLGILTLCMVIGSAIASPLLLQSIGYANTKTYVDDVIGAFKLGASDFLENYVKTVGAKVAAAGEEAAKAFVEYHAKLALDIGKSAQAIADDIVEGLEIQKQFLSQALSDIRDTLTGVVESIGNAVTNFTEKFTNALMSWSGDVKSTLVRKVDDVIHSTVVQEASKVPFAFALLNQGTSTGGAASQLPKNWQEFFQPVRDAAAKAGQSIVARATAGADTPFTSVNYDPTTATPAEGVVGHGEGATFSLHLPFEAPKNGQRVKLTLAGDAADKVSVYFRGERITQEGDGFLITIKEGRRDAFITIVEHEHIEQNGTLAVKAQLLGSTGMATHIPSEIAHLQVRGFVYQPTLPEGSVIGYPHELVTGRDVADELSGGLGDDVLVGGDDPDDEPFPTSLPSNIPYRVGTDELQGDHYDTERYGDQDPDFAGGNDRIYGDARVELSAYVEQTRTLVGTSQYGDWMTASRGKDLLVGGANRDVMFGGSDEDTFAGGAGDDFIWGDGDWSTSGPDAREVGYEIDNSDRRFPLFVGISHNAQIAVNGRADLAYGGGGNDFINGEYGADTLFGDSGDDVLKGGGDGDVLYGGDGDDWIYGEWVRPDLQHTVVIPERAGDDFIDGGSGNDLIYAGQGSDTVFAGSGDDVVDGESGLPEYDASAGGNDYLDGEDGNDEIVGSGGADRIYGGAGNDKLYGDKESVPSSVHGNDWIDAGADDDTVRGHGGDDTIFGGKGIDKLAGDEGNDYIEGNDGNDVIFGDANDDLLYGGDDDDEIHGGTGADLLDGEAKADRLYGEAGNDVLEGGEGDDSVLSGGIGNDVISGGAGTDVLSGDENDDELDGGKDRDILQGGEGHDTYVLNVGDAPVSKTREFEGITDSAGNDVVRFGEGVAPSSIRVEPDTDPSKLVIRFGADDGVIINDGYNGAINRFEFADGTSLTLSEFIDRYVEKARFVRVTASNSMATGGAGNDVLSAASGSVSFSGGRGADVINVTGDENTIEYRKGDGTDSIRASSNTGSLAQNNRVVFGQGLSASDLKLEFDGALVVNVGWVVGDKLRIEGIDRSNIAASSIIDAFVFQDGTTLSMSALLQRSVAVEGTDSDDTLETSNLNEVIRGARGDDLLSGQTGSDTYTFARGDGQDTIDERGALGDVDIVRFAAGIDVAQTSFTRTLEGDLRIQYGGTDQIVMRGFYLDERQRIERFEWADGTYRTVDTLLSLPHPNIEGTALNDVLTGGKQNDSIHALAGDDRLIGGLGDDVLDGGTGGDTYVMSVNSGHDQIVDSAADLNEIVLDASLSLDVIRATVEGADIVVTAQGTSASMRLQGAASNAGAWHIRDSGGAAVNLSTVLSNSTAERTDVERSLREQAWLNQRAVWVAEIESNRLEQVGANTWARHGASEAEAVFSLTTTSETRTVQLLSGATSTGETLYASQVPDVRLTKVRSGSPFAASIFNSNASIHRNSVSVDGQIADHQFVRQLGRNFSSEDRSAIMNVDWRVTRGPEPFSRVTGGNTTWIFKDNIDGTRSIVGTTESTYRQSGVAGVARGRLLESSTPSSLPYAWLPSQVNVGVSTFTTDYNYGEALGGSNNDSISGVYFVSGGAGDDALQALGTAVGGAGDDFISATPIIYGGEGNDRLVGYHLGATTFVFSGADAGFDFISMNPYFSFAGAYYQSLGIRDRAPYDVWIYDRGFDDDGGGGRTIEFTSLSELQQFAEEWGLDPNEVLAQSTFVPGGPPIPNVSANDFEAIDAASWKSILPENTLRFEGSIWPESLSVSWRNEIFDRSGDRRGEGSMHAILRVQWAADRGVDIVVPQDDANIASGIRKIEFADGTFMTISQLLAMAGPHTRDPSKLDNDMSGNENNNSLWGLDGNDTLRGLSGDDQLSGDSGNDVLVGGLGNDYLYGGAGDDTYVFNVGDGQDIVNDTEGANRLVLGAGISPDDIRLGLGSLLVRVGNDSDAIHFEGFDPQNPVSFTGLSSVAFADGSSFTLPQLLARGFDIAGTAESNSLNGTSMVDRLEAGAGDDYVYAYAGDDKVNGGVGDDQLYGAEGIDEYQFEVGDGHDVIHDSAEPSAKGNTIRFGAGISPTDVTLTQEGSTLQIHYGATDQIDVLNYDASGANGTNVIERLLFADGRSIVLGTTANQSPTGSPLPTQNVAEDASWSWTVPPDTFTDPDAQDVLTYSASLDNGDPLPSWLSFDAATRTFSGTALNDHVGTINVRVAATDTAGASAASTFALSVTNTNDAPIVGAALANPTTDEDAAFNYTVPASAFSDADVGDSLILSATRADGTALPSWLGFNAATRTFSGTPGNANVGNLALQVTATDVSGASVSQTFTLDVRNVNDAPIVGNPIADQNTAEDAVFSFALPVSTFTDVDVGDSLTLSAKLANGDVLPSWLTFDPTTRTFSGTPANDHVGVLDIDVTATDIAGAKATDRFVLAVTNTNDAPVVSQALVSQSTAEDGVFSYTVPANTFSDVDVGDTLSYTATRADGTALPSWLTFNPTTRVLSGTPLNGDVGALNVRITATDSAGASASSTFALAVTNTNDAPVVANLIPDRSATEAVAFSYQVPANTFTDVDAGDTLTYSATQANGTALPSWLGFNPSTRTLSGTPGATSVGTLTVRVNATDSAGAVTSDDFVITVAGSAGTTLNGTSGADTLNGTSGNDTFTGGAGNDVLNGFGGDDIYNYNTNDGLDQVNDTAGNDRVQLGTGITFATVAARTSVVGGVTYANVRLLDASGSEQPGQGFDFALDAGGVSPIETFRFSDASTKTLSQLLIQQTTITAGQNQTVVAGDRNDNTITAGLNTTTISAGSGHDIVYGSQNGGTISGGGGNDYIRGNLSNDVVDAGSGIDIVSTSNGQDTLNGGTGNDLLFAGDGVDTVSGGDGNDLMIGGLSQDTMNAGAGNNVFAFNKGDGIDTVLGTTGAVNALSLGKCIKLADLEFTKSGNDLNLEILGGDRVVLKDWYLSANNRNFTKLQVIQEAAADFNPSGTDQLRNNKVEQFNFTGLVQAFDTARAANASLSRWALTNALANFNLGGSDTAALGGDLAYQYGKPNGTLVGIGITRAQETLNDPNFATTNQTLRPLATMQEGLVKIA